MTIRTIAAAAAMAALATPTLAGSLADPIVEPVVIAEDAASSSVGPGAFVLLPALIVFAAAASN